MAGAEPAWAGVRVVLVGADGGSWNVIDPVLAAGEMPHLAALLERGGGAELETVEPVISPVVWSSLATGRSPEEHGVGGFLATRLYLKTPTVFERLAGAGLRVGLYEYLVTWPPPALPDGFVVPGWMRRDERVWPEDLWKRAGVPAFRVSYDEVISRDEYARSVRDELVRKPATFAALLAAWQPDVAATIVYAPDRTGHRYWREAYGDDPSTEYALPLPREASLMRHAMRGLDAGLGVVQQELGPDDVLLLASDHGFQAGDPHNVWVGRMRDNLAAEGLDPERDGFAILGEFGAVAVRVLPGPFDARDAVLDRLAALFRSARDLDGNALLDVYVIDAVERPEGKERSLWNRVYQWGVRQAARLLFKARFQDPAHGWVLARFKAERMAALWPDAEVRLGDRTLRADALAFREDFDGRHHPTAIFVAAGGPIRKQGARGRLSVLDVAPLISYLATGTVPDDLEGVLPLDWIDPAWLAAHPPRVVPASEMPGLPARDDATRPEVGDDEMLERLRSLGYFD